MGRGDRLCQRLGVIDWRRFLPRFADSLWLVLTVASVAGCGGDGPSTFNAASVVPLVPDALLPSASHLVDDVECYLPEPSRLGPLACTAVVAGLEIPVLVHSPGLDGRIRIESPAKVVLATNGANHVNDRLRSETGVEARTACVPEARVARKGQAFDCTAIDPADRQIPIRVTLVDAAGAFRVDWRSGDGP